MKRTLCTALLVAIALTTAAHATPVLSAARSADIANNPGAVTARNAILLDQATSRLLWSKDVDKVVQPASLTKLMTLKLVFEAIDAGKVKMGDLVPISERAWKTGGSRMFLRVDTRVPLEDLIKGIAVVSGNDACVAVAEFVGGTVENFVGMMNKRAQEMGLSRTRFVDPHGLSDDNQVSARDIANLASTYLRDHPKSLTYHSMKEFTFVPAGGRPVTQPNRNRLLGAYTGADGLKTGHTSAAGFNLAATAQRGSTRFVAVVMGVKAKTEQLGEELRAREVARILDYGFANFETRPLVAAGEKMGDIRVYKGAKDTVAAGSAEEVMYTVEKNGTINVSRKVSLQNQLVAPVKKGQSVGSLSIMVNEQEVQNVKLVALEDVQPGGLFRRMIDSIRLLFQRTVKFE